MLRLHRRRLSSCLHTSSYTDLLYVSSYTGPLYVFSYTDVLYISSYRHTRAAAAKAAVLQQFPGITAPGGGLYPAARSEACWRDFCAFLQVYEGAVVVVVLLLEGLLRLQKSLLQLPAGDPAASGGSILLSPLPCWRDFCAFLQVYLSFSPPSPAGGTSVPSCRCMTSAPSEVPPAGPEMSTHSQ